MPNKNHLGPMLMSQWAFSWYQSPGITASSAFLTYFKDRKIIIYSLKLLRYPIFRHGKNALTSDSPTLDEKIAEATPTITGLITGWDIHPVYYPHLKPFVENYVPSRNDKYHETYHHSWSFIKDFQGSTTTLVFVYRNNLSWNFETEDEPFSYVVSHHQEKLYHSFQVKRKSLSVCQGGNGVAELWVWKSSQIVEESP